MENKGLFYSYFVIPDKRTSSKQNKRSFLYTLSLRILSAPVAQSGIRAPPS